MKKNKFIFISLFCLLLLFLAFSARKVSADGNVSINATNFPDSVFRSYVADAFDTNGDSKLSASEISAATRINVSDYNVSSLKGIEFLTSLEELNCAYGELTELNVSKNNELTELDCTFNNLTVLDVSKNTKLTRLDCAYNNIKELDISNNPELIDVYTHGELEVTDGDDYSYYSYFIYWEEPFKYYTLTFDKKTKLYTEPLSITDSPKDVKASVGDDVQFSIQSSRDTARYQWYYRNSSSESWKLSSSSSAKTKTFSFTAQESHDGHQYRCAVTSCGITIYSNTVMIKIKPNITSQPSDVLIAIDQTVKLTVAGSGPNLSYQWQYRNSSTDTWKNSTMACAKTNTFSFKAAESHSGHQYRCSVSNAAGAIYTRTATVTVRPLITTQPNTSVTVAVGGTVKLTTAAKGTNLKYQWQYRNSSTDTWKNSTMACAKTNTFTFTAAESHSGHQYRCNVSNGKGTTPTKTVTVTVTPKITTQPANASVAVDCTAKFTVAAKGTNLTYQWQYRNSSTDTWKNSTMACAKTAVFSFKVAESHSGHQYRCAVSNGKGTAYSNAATLTVRPLITTQPKDTTVSKGATVKLTVAAKGTNLTYQWQYRNSSTDTWKNSTMACAKTNTFTFTAAASHSGHQYRCAVSNGKGTTYTKTATLTVK